MLSVMADGRRVSVINAPGRQRARPGFWPRSPAAWREAGLGPVIGITAYNPPATPWPRAGSSPTTVPSSSATSPARRGARGRMPSAPGALLAVDEASMLGTPDLADLIDIAERHGGEAMSQGDTEQLQAVQNGGGMSLLADRLGYVRLPEPVRFRAGWERAASLRLRHGDATVLDEYERHARITGGDPELWWAPHPGNPSGDRSRCRLRRSLDA